MRLTIRVIPNARQEKLSAGKAYVKAKPVGGEANLAVIALVAKQYNVHKSDVRILRGKTSRMKVIEITSR
ncbi:MAG: DUF167 domain-containing protein [Candidatus Woesearchaeota archaeon]|jgi:hypothetical protein|nr:DUF167 domain-containing protein [Candidatus Woesearchaeota archaeon]MDP7181415.1 DUF167 domain-containing protein [Candidatus Woesearchaeota archaeon]MDP7198457.1 DUF167 domain-containing protein [Candidatus Woesearchaeota archaeon]MDP7466801.1 DUF167 domain-containing protein [Candidatus Woesearchaeota archaeon]MDP7648026.1 DUF167 domain-containing protein [Candidatus Woesearchaeota archaeon]|tara:strand:+ start:93 stop:302 length:210 start_codon:yes stop_codon:yes gene_type:complete